MAKSTQAPDVEEEQEQALWDAYRESRSPALRERIVEKYLPLVNVIAGRVALSLPSHVDRDDLVSSGFFGLLDAIERYDYARGNKFETYGGVRIRGAMIDYLRSVDWIPVSQRQKIRRYEQAVTELEGKLGRPATDEELATELQISPEELRELIAQTGVATVMPLEDYMQLESPISQAPDPAETVEKNEMRDTLARAIDALPKKERTVVSLYYYEQLTLKEISLILHLSEARISQIHTKAVFRLRGAMVRARIGLGH